MREKTLKVRRLFNLPESEELVQSTFSLCFSSFHLFNFLDLTSIVNLKRH